MRGLDQSCSIFTSLQPGSADAFVFFLGGSTEGTEFAEGQGGVFFVVGSLFSLLSSISCVLFVGTTCQSDFVCLFLGTCQRVIDALSSLYLPSTLVLQNISGDTVGQVTPQLLDLASIYRKLSQTLYFSLD